LARGVATVEEDFRTEARDDDAAEVIRDWEDLTADDITAGWMELPTMDDVVDDKQEVVVRTFVEVLVSVVSGIVDELASGDTGALGDTDIGVPEQDAQGIV